MSVLLRSPNEQEKRLQRLEALERQFATDILRLWKRSTDGADQEGIGQTSIHPLDESQVFESSGFWVVSGSHPGSGPSSPVEGSGSQTYLNTGQSGGASGAGRSGGTLDRSGGTLQTGGTITGGTTQTGATVGTGQTGGHITGGTFTGQGTGGTAAGTPESGINTGRSGGGSGPGLSGGTALSGSPQSGSPLSGTPQSGVCVGPLLSDNFSGVSVDLQYHSPDYDRYSGGWLGDTSELRLDGLGYLTPKDASIAAGTHEYRAFAQVQEKNVTLIAGNATIGSANGGSNRGVGFVVRYVSDLDHWIVRVNRSSLTLEIIEVNGGSRTVRASAGIPSSAADAASATMSVVVRDKYIRFAYGVKYWVSYGSASYLETATRHGLFFSHTGTVNSGQKIGNVLIDCLGSDESGTGLSGSRSESHLSGGGTTGGTPLNTGGTPVTGGTQPSGTGTGTTWEDPNSDVSYTWSDASGSTNYQRVDDAYRPPNFGGSDWCYADPNDDNEEAVFGYTQRLTSGTVSKITAWARMVAGNSTISVDIRVKLNGSWQTAGTVSVVNSPTTWYSKVYTGSWNVQTQIYPLQMGVKPGSIGKIDDLYLYQETIRLDYT